MSKYFKPIEFEEVKLVEEKKEEYFPPASTFDDAIQKYHMELRRVENGSSKFYKNAIQFPKGICLSSINLDRFYDNPSKESLKTFLASCAEEINMRFAQEIVKFFSEPFPKAKDLL